MPVGDIAKAVFTAFIYGVSFVAIRLAVGDLPPLLVTGYRFGFAAIPLIFLVARPAIGLGWLAAYGIMQGAVMFGLVFSAIAMGMPAGLASLVAQLQVFFTIILAAVLMQERPTGFQIAGIVTGFCGIALLGVAESHVPLVPFLMVIASAFAWGVANIIAKYAKPRADESLGFIVWSSLPAALVLFGLSTLLEGTLPAVPPHVPKWSTMAAIAFLAIITQVWAFSLWVGLLNRHAAARVMPFALLIPVFGLASTALAFGQPLTVEIGAASALVLTGLAISIRAGRRA